MKYILFLLVTAAAAFAQTGTLTIQGNVLDAKSQKPIPAALIIANRAAVPAFSKHTKSGADGAFQIQGLTPGTYSLCVLAPGDQYLDPCQWNAASATLTLASGQNLTGLSLKLTAASILNIQVQDAQKVLAQATRDGRRPNLTLGVWGPGGQFYPVHLAGTPPAGTLPVGIPTYSYRLAVPRDTALSFYIASHDLKLGDAGGTLLPSASQQPFQHATGDPNPKSFAFNVLGLLP